MEWLKVKGLPPHLPRASQRHRSCLSMKQDRFMCFLFHLSSAPYYFRSSRGGGREGPQEMKQDLWRPGQSLPTFPTTRSTGPSPKREKSQNEGESQNDATYIPLLLYCLSTLTVQLQFSFFVYNWSVLCDNPRVYTEFIQVDFEGSYKEQHFWNLGFLKGPYYRISSRVNKFVSEHLV